MAQTPEEMAQAINDKIEAIKTQVSDVVSKEDFTKLEKELSTIKSKVEDETTTKTIEDLQEQINILKENNNARVNTFKSFEQQVAEQLEANRDALKALKGNANKEIVLKVVGNQTTANITLPVATPAAYSYQNDLTLIPAPDLIPFVQNWTDNGTTDRVSLAYVDEVSQEGDAAFIGEGIVKPLIDIDYEIRYSAAKKVAGKIKVSEEALDDIPFMQSEINRKLRQRHDLVLQDGILNGDGTGANLAGITDVAAAFAAGGLAVAITAPTNYDAIVATYNQIIVTSDGNYVPNAIFVNPTDATLMKLTKDLDNNYIMPPFVGADGQVVNGVRVVENTKIPAGFYLMGDFTKAHVRTYKEFSIRIGYTNDDFEKNLITLLGESRVHLWISENEKIAFVYDQFSVAKTALTAV
jgi:HK97 family phage major capsid protein